MFHFDDELKKLPASPGVYIMHDADDAIIYVGKAISLRNRVRSYFRESTVKSPKIEKMVSRIARFEYIVTDSELEALVLENNLIKEHSPKYNTMLKDDKSYPYIKVTVEEEFPRVLFSRTMKKDKSRYFGPYTSAGAVSDTIDLIHKLWKIRTCTRNLPKDIGKERPCLNYHIKQCNAPCQGYVSKEEYGQSVAQVLEFLNGNHKPVLSMLEKNVRGNLAKAMDYMEQALALDRSCRGLILNAAQLMLEYGANERCVELYHSLNSGLRAESRLQLYAIIALIRTQQYEAAAAMLGEDFLLSDIVEGELSLSHVWYELYRNLVTGAPENATTEELNRLVDAQFPLPAQLDFRMS